MKGHLSRVILIALLAMGPQADAQTDPRRQAEEAAELARRAAEKMIEALRGMLLAVPQYESPELLPNGDIIIRRKALPPPPPPAPPSRGENRDQRT
jgi:hypothetical protein